jgi:hypothetical protein
VKWGVARVLRCVSRVRGAAAGLRVSGPEVHCRLRRETLKPARLWPSAGHGQRRGLRDLFGHTLIRDKYNGGYQTLPGGIRGRRDRRGDCGR